MTRRLAIIGMGKMGRAIAQLAPERGWEIVARLDEAEASSGMRQRLLAGADVAVEFTVRSAAPGNIQWAIETGCPIVVGTTGWYDELPALSEWTRSHGGALLTAANFSLGVNIFEQIAVRAAELLAHVPGFDAHIVEMHHAAKPDAPSGTAASLERAASRPLGKSIPITSVRTGSMPGVHEFIFDAPFETIRLSHSARDRRVFAEGALVAAGWLIGRKGVFTMKDVLASAEG